MAGNFDVILVGGGLASSLIALAVVERHPRARVALVERSPKLGGNHTWCFHAGDVPPGAAPWVAPLVVERWPGYDVHFPRRDRRVDSPYACVTSERLHDVTREKLARADGALLLSSEAEELTAGCVRLRDGATVHGAMVIDARGPSSEARAHSGYQKFVGLELSLQGEVPRLPLLFDARVAQRDGFRFMYVLPFADGRVLVEETFFSDSPLLDVASSRSAILRYVADRGWTVRGEVREEHGILPMPWREPPLDFATEPLRAGYGGGLFHPVTGYSFAYAARFALAVAESLFDPERRALRSFAQAYEVQRPFLLLLARMLFTCFAPDQRFRVIEHFYRLPAKLIERFYAAELSALDRARILVGAPPPGFSFTRAVRSQLATGAPP